eukprot:scaffold9843_cov140-Isochrysis_galbana.AAC.2
MNKDAIKMIKMRPCTCSTLTTTLLPLPAYYPLPAPALYARAPPRFAARYPARRRPSVVSPCTRVPSLVLSPTPPAHASSFHTRQPRADSSVHPRSYT